MLAQERFAVDTPAPPPEALRLRSDDGIDAAFLLQLALALVVLLGGLTAWVRWVARYRPAGNAGKPSPLAALGHLSISPRTRVTLLSVDGSRVLLTESTQGIDVRFMPTPPDAPISRDAASPESR
jgi:flagellar biogenesis protein FliO